MAVVAREQWGAPAGRAHLPPLGDSNGFGLHYNGPAIHLTDHADCAPAVQGIRRYHVDTRGWLDIAYSFLVCPHGTIFEGRGWGKRTAANGTTYGNSWGHAAMCLIGVDQLPTAPMLGAVEWLCERHDARYGHVDLRPHSAFKNTACPGDPLRAWAESGAWKPTEELTLADIRELKALIRRQGKATRDVVRRRTDALAAQLTAIEDNLEAVDAQIPGNLAREIDEVRRNLRDTALAAGVPEWDIEGDPHADDPPDTA